MSVAMYVRNVYHLQRTSFGAFLCVLSTLISSVVPICDIRLSLQLSLVAQFIPESELDIAGSDLCGR